MNKFLYVELFGVRLRGLSMELVSCATREVVLVDHIVHWCHGVFAQLMECETRNMSAFSSFAAIMRLSGILAEDRVDTLLAELIVHLTRSRQWRKPILRAEKSGCRRHQIGRLRHWNSRLGRAVEKFKPRRIEK